MAYESPIKVDWIYHFADDAEEAMRKLMNEEEAYLMYKVNLVVDVDKDELLKALRYDRDQYNHGYSDGWYAKEESIVHCKDCKNHEWCSIEEAALNDKTFFCKRGERRENEQDKE